MSPELDIAQQVLDLVRPSGAAAEVAVDQNATGLTRFANSFIHQNIVDSTTSVRLRLHLAGRTATGTTTVTSTDGLHDLVERTLGAARVCPPDPAWPGLTPPAPLAGAGSYDEETAAAGPDQRADRVAAFVAAGGGLEMAGFCQTTRWSGALANTAGHAVSGRAAGAAMDGIARLDGADGVARISARRLSEVDGAVLGARAAAKARSSVGPVELPAGRYEVVLEPAAVADLLDNLGFYGFNGKALTERRSFVALGEEQFDPAVTLVDEGPEADGPGRPYDAEGTPKRRLVMVEAGRTSAVAHDRRTAVKAGTESTGHALPTSATWGPVPASLRLAAAAPVSAARPSPTTAAPVSAARPSPTTAAAAPAAGPSGSDVDLEGSVAALVAGVDRGILVSDLWYTRVLDPRTLVVTGLTRNGVWLIEQGAVTRPVRNFRFTQSYPQALGPGAVLGVGTYTASMPGNLVGQPAAPALRLASWNFTGTASG